MTGRHCAARGIAKRAASCSAEVRSMPTAIIAATAAVSLLNYSFTLILLWVLPSHEYAVVASVTALLLVFGTVAGASAPWVLAREVAVSGKDSRRRQRAVAFASVLTLGQAAMAALVCALIVASRSEEHTSELQSLRH